MTDLKSAYMKAMLLMDEEQRQPYPNEAIVQACRSLMNVIASDIRFRAQGFLELATGSDR
jgi:hypothetical protein